MRFIIITAFLVCSLVVNATIAGAAELQPRDPGRDSKSFTLPDFKNRAHSLSDYRGKVVLVNFWASWCPPCIYEMPAMSRLKQRLQDRPFEILAVNVGEKKYKVRKFVKLVDFELTVLLDAKQDTFRKWGVRTLPTSFIIDASGRVRYRVRGDPGWDDEQTMAIIERLIAEQPTNEKAE